MNRTDCIELANQLTERKGEKLIDLNLLFNTTVQDICKRQRFWWRKLDVTFSLAAGTKTYDITTITTSPALSEIVFDEIITLAIILQTSPSLQVVELSPITDPVGIRAMKQNVTQAQPSRYTVGVDDWKTIRIDPPDTTYTAELTFWAMPYFDKDTASNAIPLIPPFYHNIIVEGIEARINKRVYGPDDKRYIDSVNSYEASILKAGMRPQFNTQSARQWTSSDSNDYTQSTAPNSP